MNYWFKNKKYGLGWTPANYKGWLVLLVFILMIIALSLYIKKDINHYLLYVIFLTLFLIVICYKTGEPIRWRRD